MNTRDPDTYLRGEACYQAKLKETDVMAAIKHAKSGASVTHIAQRLGVNRKTLADAINGRTWKHVARAMILMLAMTTAAHAESWIIVVSRTDAAANGEPFQAMIDPYIYNNAAQCLYVKGQWEGVASTKAPDGTYNVWCAKVPGLVARK